MCYKDTGCRDGKLIFCMSGYFFFLGLAALAVLL